MYFTAPRDLQNYLVRAMSKDLNLPVSRMPKVVFLLCGGRVSSLKMLSH